MSILGKPVEGKSEHQVLATSGFSIVSGPYLASENGTINSISIRTRTAGVNLRLGVYLHDDFHSISSKPTELIASSDSVPITDPGLQTLNITNQIGTIQKGKRYWIAAIASGDIAYEINRTEEKWIWNQSGVNMTLRNPFLTGGGSTLFRAICAYITYTPSDPPTDNSLQGIINRATPGETVRIPYGFYNESIIINKSMKLDKVVLELMYGKNLIYHNTLIKMFGTKILE